ALSVGVLIVVMSVMMGFDQQLRSVIRGYRSDIKVTPLTSRLYGFREEDWQRVRKMALKIEHVKAAAPFIEGPALLLFSEGEKVGEHMQHVFFRGIDPQLEPGVSGFARDFMSQGSLADLTRTYVPDEGRELSHCLIGSALAASSPFQQVMRDFFRHAAALRAGELVLGLRSPGASRGITAELDEAVSRLEEWMRTGGQEAPKAKQAAIKAVRGVSKGGLSPEARAKLQEAVTLLESGLPEEERERIAWQFRSVREAPDYEEAGRRLDEIIARESTRYPVAVRIFKLYREHILHNEVVLYTVSPDSSSPMPARRWKMFRVADTIETGRYDYDSTVVLVSLEDAMAFVKSDGGITGLNIRLDDYAHAPGVIAALRAELGDFYIIQTWEDQERPFLEAVAMEQFLMAVIQSFVGILAGFCIFAILTMTVYEKRHDIGVLKAIGFTPAAIARVFLFDGAAIGVIGAAVGVAG
ncbi:MAG: hypothetical protein QGH74_01125, partial [Candidatus Brocadiia bacterium]|nr:hypothetical protein [Candidatus Brocadiia bacterium]